MNPVSGTAVAAPPVAAVRAGLPALPPREVLARAAWTLLPKSGDRVAGALVGLHGASAALEIVRRDAAPGDPRELLAARDRWRHALDAGLAERAVRDAAALGARLLVPGDPCWPAGLPDLGPHGPLALWALGDPSRLQALPRSVALVGARAATDYGLTAAVDLAAGLVDRGFAVVSGAAYGIDGAAHRAALTGGGLTVAVLAGGLDRLYPAGNRDLLRRIAADGVVLSESACGVAPERWRFLDRNRLIAAVSAATVVVEAGNRSGALNTAGHAAELGRPLGAVPGSIRSAVSAGCHHLLREYGAVCIRDAADAAELVDPDAAESAAGRTPTESRVLTALTDRPRPLAAVAAIAGVEQDDAEAVLGLLELTGEAVRSAAGWRRTG